MLGLNNWDQTFSRGIVHYNYRRIDEDIFGKSYEMFLAANRKDEGIYYTPAGITGPMADSLVNSLAGKLTDEICEAVGSQKCDFARAEELMAQLAELRVADTACGSRAGSSSKVAPFLLAMLSARGRRLCLGAKNPQAR